LPFDLWLEEIRAFLAELGVSRRALMEIARYPGANDYIYAKEVLSLAAGEAALVAPDPNATVSDPWTYWGLAQDGNSLLDVRAGITRNGNWLSLLRQVSVLMQLSRLSYRELLDILQTSLGETSRPDITPAEECELSKLQMPGLTPTQLDWIHRFTRLWRRAGCTIRELDRAIHLFPNRIDQEAIRGLAVTQRLSERLHLPFLHITGILGYLETQSWTQNTKEGSPTEPSLYHRLFQQNALRGSASFKYFASASLGTGQSLTAHAEFIASALGISPADVTLLVNAGAALHLTDDLTIESLTILFGATQFGRSLGLSVDAFLRWQVVLAGC